MVMLNATADDGEYVVDRKTAEQLCQLYGKTLADCEASFSVWLSELYADYPHSTKINLEPLMDWLRSFD